MNPYESCNSYSNIEYLCDCWFLLVSNKTKTYCITGLYLSAYELTVISCIN